ncbi:alpha/beta fold hydrolase [Micromonospora sp. NPDC050686]|uniref:alpha/beta fold hydrolase n=1 Tax=Micromonospora sp. NPDC050686 TaxID=3154631 RepID=UPI0033F15BD3
MTRSVGRWKSPGGERAYTQAYRAILSGLPAPSLVQDVTITYGRVHVLMWRGRESGPPVLLLPGRGSGALMWSENMPDWIGHRTVYALDPIGDSGLSVQCLPLKGFEDQADWIAETLHQLNIAQAHVVGHSFGGANAAIFAVRHPELVATLTLLEPVMVIERLAASTYFWATVTQLPVPQRVKDKALAEIGGTTVAEVRHRTPMSTMISMGASNYTAALPIPRKLNDDQWRHLAMPIRVDIGGTKSLAGGAKAADRIRRLLPHADVHYWPDATHSLPMQKHQQLDPELLAFWRGNSQPQRSSDEYPLP